MQTKRAVKTIGKHAACNIMQRDQPIKRLRLQRNPKGTIAKSKVERESERKMAKK